MREEIQIKEEEEKNPFASFHRRLSKHNKKKKSMPESELREVGHPIKHTSNLDRTGIPTFSAGK
jgi:hypothetical protein